MTDSEDASHESGISVGLKSGRLVGGPWRFWSAGRSASAGEEMESGGCAKR